MFLGRREIQVTLTYTAGSARLMFPRVHGTFPSNIHAIFFLKTLQRLPTALRKIQSPYCGLQDATHTALTSLLQQHLQGFSQQLQCANSFPLYRLCTRSSLCRHVSCRSHTWFLQMLLGSVLIYYSLKEVFPASPLRSSLPTPVILWYISDFLHSSYHNLKLFGLFIPLLVYGLPLLS